MTLADDCACGARPGPDLVHCHRCHTSMPLGDLDNHLRLFHPDEEPHLAADAVLADDRMIDALADDAPDRIAVLLAAFQRDTDTYPAGQQ